MNTTKPLRLGFPHISDMVEARKRIEHLEYLLVMALPYVEEATISKDYKNDGMGPKKLAREIRGSIVP